MVKLKNRREAPVVHDPLQRLLGRASRIVVTSGPLGTKHLVASSIDFVAWLFGRAAGVESLDGFRKRQDCGSPFMRWHSDRRLIHDLDFDFAVSVSHLKVQPVGAS